MTKEIIFTTIGALAGFFATMFVGILSNRFSYKNLFAETISKSRNNWINIWRDEISNFLAISDMLRFEKEKIQNHDYIELMKEYHIAKNKIIMRLNMNEKRHQEVYLLINKIAYEEIDDEEYRVLKESLMAVTQDLLKKEWERVKLEARGKRKWIMEKKIVSIKLKNFVN